MADPKHLQIERNGGVVRCLLSNPPRHTLTATGVRELRALVDSLQGDSEVRVLELRGAEDGVFIAHYEVGELADSAESQTGGEARDVASDRGSLHEMHRLCLALEASPFVTVAAINGNAAGGGLELALACDFRLALRGDYRLGLPETTVGILPGAGGTQRLTRLLGTARALDLILHGTLYTPDEALELGVVHRVFAPDRYTADVRAFVDDLAARAPIALAQAKRAIQAAQSVPLVEGLALEQDAFGRTMRTEDAAGALRAALRGERWTWRGK